MNDESTVKFKYGAASNISFHGTIDTEIPVSEWKWMSNDEQERVFTNALYDLVDIWEEAE